MSRPGRKRKDTPRDRSGRARRSKRDSGTAELRRRRQWLAQGGDETKAEYPLGVMLVNDIIGVEPYRAGCRFAWLHFVIFGRQSLIARAWDAAAGGSGMTEILDEDAEDWLMKREHELKQGDAAFPTNDHRRVIMSLAVHEIMPRWILPKRRQPEDYTWCQMTIEGLESLARGFGSMPRQ